MLTRSSLALASIALLAGCFSAGTSSNSSSPGVYLDHALKVMRTNAIYTPSQGWSVVIREARKMATGAKVPADTYGAIIYALDQLRQAGDLHANFANPFTAKLQDQAAKPSDASPIPLPTVSLFNHRLGLIDLPAVGSQSPNARRYALSALSRISALQSKHHPCGWVVDLRDNPGGDMYPMLLSVGPILGNGRLIGFTGKMQSRVFVFYRSGTLSGGGFTDHAPVRVANFAPAPPVAVLTGPVTISSGEAVTIAFRGRPQTRSFGAPTGGATNSPQSYRLADGATLRFSVAWDTDREGTIYMHPINPNMASDTPLQAAQDWLLSTPACSHAH